MRPMILGFNIGNTHTVMGLFREEEPVPYSTFKYRTEKGQSPGTLRKSLEDHISHVQLRAGDSPEITGLAFSSVVPEVNTLYNEISRLWGVDTPLQIGPDCRLGIQIRYDEPSQLGVDRIVNAAAAFHEYRRDTVIVDLGTAVTFCVLHGDGFYDGGIIAPGAGVSSKALSRETAQLPRVDLEKPIGLIATNTREALRSGLFYGWIAMVEGIFRRIEHHYGKSFFLLLTGGYAAVLSDHIHLDHHMDPLLTLKGIKYIHFLNRF